MNPAIIYTLVVWFIWSNLTTLIEAMISNNYRRLRRDYLHEVPGFVGAPRPRFFEKFTHDKLNKRFDLDQVSPERRAHYQKLLNRLVNFSKAFYIVNILALLATVAVWIF